MANTKKRSMTEKELNRLVIKWQKRLRLMDWNIQAKFDEDELLQEWGAWGACNPQGFLREAVMIFRHPDEAKLVQPKYDLEVIVVHELLHIFFAPIKHRDHAGLNAEEQMIHTIAILMVDLERHGKKAGRATSFDSLETGKGHTFSCAYHSFKKDSYDKGNHCGN
jgi:hypothetical protein